MAYPTKIASCCYCGSRAALKLHKTRHELSCASCGAPLKELKMIRQPTRPKTEAKTHQPEPRRFPAQERRKWHQKKKPRRQRRGGKWLKDIAEEMFDFVEDIFD